VKAEWRSARYTRQTTLIKVALRNDRRLLYRTFLNIEQQSPYIPAACLDDVGLVTLESAEARVEAVKVAPLRLTQWSFAFHARTRSMPSRCKFGTMTNVLSNCGKACLQCFWRRHSACHSCRSVQLCRPASSPHPCGATSLRAWATYLLLSCSGCRLERPWLRQAYAPPMQGSEWWKMIIKVFRHSATRVSVHAFDFESSSKGESHMHTFPNDSLGAPRALYLHAQYRGPVTYVP
jgi:hypothetical protein